MLTSFFVGCATSSLEKAEHQHHAKMMQGDMTGGNQVMNHEQHKTGSRFFENRENAVVHLTENKLYKVSLFCNESPIPMRRIHDWTVHIETPDGKPVENAKVFIFGGMPMHNHEFPTVPVVREYLGNGDYRIEGVKFSMIGHWEMHLTVEEGRKRDRVEYKIHM